jgi:type II secretory pathway component PulF
MISIKRKFNRADLILLFERLELYIASGLALNKALAILGEGMLEREKTAIKKVCLSIESGNSLSRALRKSLNISLTISGLIENGENGGKLAEALNSSRKLLEKEDELWKKCASAMAYPIIIGLFSLVITIGLMRGVMPQIIPMLKSLHMQLPLLTRIVMALSDILMAYGLYLALLIVLLPIAFLYLYKKNQLIRKFTQSILIRFPLFGDLIYSYSFSLFLLSCGSLIESGMGSATAYENAVGTSSLIPLRNELSKELPSISRGVSISIAFRKMKRIRPFMSPLLSAGEISGTLGKSLLRGAMILDREIEYSLKKITALVEPFMMAGMGLIVGAIALSIMMPIYDISKALQH